MQQFHGISQNLIEHIQSFQSSLRLTVIKSWLNKFNIPVAEFFPDELIDLLGNTKFKPSRFSVTSLQMVLMRLRIHLSATV